jgi:hypothetical protein
MILAQNAALSAHVLILEDGPELPKASGPHAEEFGEVLEGLFSGRWRRYATQVSAVHRKETHSHWTVKAKR